MFEHPLVERYASREMVSLFKAENKFYTWRLLWIALAEAEKELGLPITDEQIEEMRKNAKNLNLERAKEIEREVKHDVVAHIRVFAEQCPKAAGIIHLGATSCFVTDNADIIIMRDALRIIRKKLLKLIKVLRDFCIKYKDVPALGYTHLQPAQPTTVGKRACLWLQDFVMDFGELEKVIANLRFRGVKGTTGSQDSFLKLFDGDEEKVKQLDRLVTEKFGFEKKFIITGQTYTRKQDYTIASVLSQIAQSAHKMGTDIRILMAFKEIEEPLGKKQVGSSAMPYKRNPMKSERMCSLARFVMMQLEAFSYTHAVQWMERTLDDSAIRRIVIPEAFMATDAILILAANIISGLNVYVNIIEKRLREELPFIAVEEILMESVKRGGNRQLLHEKIRRYAFETVLNIRNGKDDNLLEKIASDPDFSLSKEDLDRILVPERFIGRAPSQVEEFIAEEVDPILENYRDLIDESLEEVRV